MNREELLAATYDAAEALNKLKLRYGRIDKARGHELAHHIQRARDLKERLDAIQQGDIADPEVLRGLQGEISAYSVSTVCDKRELFWRRHVVNFKVPGVLRIVLAYLRDLVRSEHHARDRRSV